MPLLINPEQWAKLKELVTISTKALQYLEERLTKSLKKNGILESEGGQALLKEVQDLKKDVQLLSYNPWGSGSRDIQFRKNLAAVEIKSLKGQEASFDFAINNQGQFVRSYTPSDKQKAFDHAFDGWLANHGVECKEGTLYKDDKLVKPDQMAKLIDDPEHGFAKFLGDKDIKLSTHQNAYPEQATQTEQEQQRSQEEIDKLLEGVLKHEEVSATESAAPTEPDVQDAASKGRSTH